MPYFSYDPVKGSRYALHYADFDSVPTNERLFYYSNDSDCTNFISQCVWASYGGWLEGFDQATIEENARRIRSDIRQVTGFWFGSKYNVGSTRWCRVLEFHDFVTNQNKQRGPYAASYGDIEPASFNPGDIRQGDILQFTVSDYSPWAYRHGVYVVKEGNTFDDILICCHSYDRKGTPLSEFTSHPKVYTKMRRLRFREGVFDK